MRRPSLPKLPRLRRGGGGSGASTPQPAIATAPALGAKPRQRRKLPPLRLIVPAAVAIVVVVLLLGTCGSDDDKKVRDTLSHFAQATRDKDYQALCDDVLSSSFVKQLRTTDQPCEIVMGIALSDLRNPTLDVRSVTVNGDKATALVHSTATGQPPADAKIPLVREGGGWRISVLPKKQKAPGSP